MGPPLLSAWFKGLMVAVRGAGVYLYQVDQLPFIPRLEKLGPSSWLPTRDAPWRSYHLTDSQKASTVEEQGDPESSFPAEKDVRVPPQTLTQRREQSWGIEPQPYCLKLSGHFSPFSKFPSLKEIHIERDTSHCLSIVKTTPVCRKYWGAEEH